MLRGSLDQVKRTSRRVSQWFEGNTDARPTGVVATAGSALPCTSKWPDVMPRGGTPAWCEVADPNVPPPFPTRADTLPGANHRVLASASAPSTDPSRLKSARATDTGPGPPLN